MFQYLKRKSDANKKQLEEKFKKDWYYDYYLKDISPFPDTHLLKEFISPIDNKPEILFIKKDLI